MGRKMQRVEARHVHLHPFQGFDVSKQKELDDKMIELLVSHSERLHRDLMRRKGDRLGM